MKNGRGGQSFGATKSGAAPDVTYRLSRFAQSDRRLQQEARVTDSFLRDCPSPRGSRLLKHVLEGRRFGVEREGVHLPSADADPTVVERDEEVRDSLCRHL